jgi:hypothetical protein
LYELELLKLKKDNLYLQSLLIKEANRRDEYLKRDSILSIKILSLYKKDKELAKKQKEIIDKYKYYTGSQLLKELDSLYKLEN